MQQHVTQYIHYIYFIEEKPKPRQVISVRNVTYYRCNEDQFQLTEIILKSYKLFEREIARTEPKNLDPKRSDMDVLRMKDFMGPTNSKTAKLIEFASESDNLTTVIVKP